MEEELKKRMALSIEHIEGIIEDIRKNNLQDTLEVLNWMDLLNDLSVTF